MPASPTYHVYTPDHANDPNITAPFCIHARTHQQIPASPTENHLYSPEADPVPSTTVVSVYREDISVLYIYISLYYIFFNTHTHTHIYIYIYIYICMYCLYYIVFNIYIPQQNEPPLHLPHPPTKASKVHRIPIPMPTTIRNPSETTANYARSNRRTGTFISADAPGCRYGQMLAQRLSVEKSANDTESAAMPG